MTPFEAYNCYLALKRHFTPNSGYDYNRYNGKTNASLKSFEGRKDKLFFYKLAKKPDVLGFLVTVLSENPKAWIGQFAYSEEWNLKYLEREKRLQALSYVITQELPEGVSFNDLFKFVDGEHPPILQSHLRSETSLDTLAALDKLVSFTKTWKSDDPVVKQTVEKIQKISPFTDFDRDAVKSAVIKHFSVDAAIE